MKKPFLFILFSLITFISIAQSDYSGQYSYSFKPKGNPPTTEKARGPNGQLVLLKMEGNKYRFWLDVTLGWPNYNVGETDGTITFVHDSASFDNTFEDAERPCVLKFKIANNIITINSQSSSFNCGFGNGVHADGEFTFTKKQPVLNNAWLKKEYYSSPTMVVISEKASLYSDMNCLYSKTDQFIKGKTLLNVSEYKSSIYTEYITPQGKFLFGWLKKTDVKVKSSN